MTWMRSIVRTANGGRPANLDQLFYFLLVKNTN
jgi:hypothetical protein